MKPVARLLGGSAILILICACQELPPPIQRPLSAVLPMPTPSLGWWNGDDVSGSPRIVVHIGQQKAYFYESKQLVGESTVSTGKPGFSTPPGNYSVVAK